MKSTFKGDSIKSALQPTSESRLSYSSHSHSLVNESHLHLHIRTPVDRCLLFACGIQIDAYTWFTHNDMSERETSISYKKCWLNCTSNGSNTPSRLTALMPTSKRVLILECVMCYVNAEKWSSPLFHSFALSLRLNFSFRSLQTAAAFCQRISVFVSAVQHSHVLKMLWLPCASQVRIQHASHTRATHMLTMVYRGVANSSHKHAKSAVSDGFGRRLYFATRNEIESERKRNIISPVYHSHCRW